MTINPLYLFDSQSLPLITGSYNQPMVVLSLFLAMLAGVMAFQLAGMARLERRQFNRQVYLISGAFVLGSGIWSMHFIGLLAFSVCSSAQYDRMITLLSMLPSFLASWVALVLIAKDKITSWQLIISGILVGAGIGVMHYSGMAAIHKTVVLRFDPYIFSMSIIVAVALSILALWLRFKLIAQQRFRQNQINIISGIVLGAAISGMHYTGMKATRFLASGVNEVASESNDGLAFLIAGITIIAILITVAGNVLLRYRTIYQRMLQTEERTRIIVDTAVDGIITVDSNGKVRAFNAAAETMFGWASSEIIGRNIDLLIPEPKSGQNDGYFQNYLRNNNANMTGSGREICGVRKSGVSFPLRLAIGKAILERETIFVGFVTDISDRKKMECALRDSEQQYRSLIGNLPGIAFRCRFDSDWSMLFISDAVERLTGWAPEEFITGQKTFAQLLHPDDVAWTTEKVSEMLKAEQAYMIEYRIIDRAGKEHWVSESASGVRGEDGNIEWIDGVIIDVSDSKRRNAEFEGVVNAIGRSLAIIEFDLKGNILHANQNFLDISHYTLNELVGQHHSLLCSPQEVNSQDYQQLWNTLRQGIYTSGDFRRFGKGGQEIWIHGSYNPIFDPDGNPYKIIKFASDLSERHAMEQDLREAKIKAEQAAAAKNTFLANMSHEIRTPMNAILGFTDVLLSEPVNDTQRRHLNTVRYSARSLLSLLNDILDTAKLERGAVELEIKDFSLREVCMQVLATLRVNAKNKELALVLDYPDHEPEFFQGDALRLQQILLNLVGNAIKFTEKGEVRLSIEWHQKSLRLVIQDTGIGIAADRLNHIFDPFAQADASMTRRFGGTGLGTTIARQLIDLMQGRIWVESELGKGSQFYVELPLPIGHQVISSHEQSIFALPPLQILAADDVPQNLELLKLILSPLGHTLTTVNNGAEAVRAFTEQRFDVILMDVQMPVLNGLDACRQIRQIEIEMESAATPIIALSASVLSEDVKAAKSAGMDSFSSKPIDLYQLTQDIARLLHIEFSPNTVVEPAPLSQVRGSVIDWSQGKKLWGSEQRHREALYQFVAEFDSIILFLRNNQNAPPALSAQVHKLKGAAANLSLSRVVSLCINIENRLINQETHYIDALFNQLADELSNVSETLGAPLQSTVLPTVQSKVLPTAHLNTTATNTPVIVDNDHLFNLLEMLENGLQRGELIEAAFSPLHQLLSHQDYSPLDDAINVFDFDTARKIVSHLKIQIQAMHEQAQPQQARQSLTHNDLNQQTGEPS